MQRILTLLALVAMASLLVVGCSDNSKSPSSPGTPEEDLTPPAAPASLTVHVKGNKVAVKWIENSEVDLASYKVYRSMNNSPYEYSGSIDRATFVEHLSDFGYFHMAYRVTALDESGNESAFSPIAEVFVDLSTPNQAQHEMPAEDIDPWL